MTTTGVLGGRWRASVSPWGAIEPWDGSPELDWHVAADDRWHSPASESAVRQTRLDGTCVVETRLRIPDGDAVQRIWSVPDAGGLTVVEIENASPLPIAVAFTHGRLLSVRPPSAPIEGISLPIGSVAFPVGHHATLLVALPHTLAAPGTLPGGLPTRAAVVRGWTTTVERASRLLTPEPRWNERVVAERCEIALAGPAHPDDDPVGFLLAVGQLVRMGERADAWVPDLAHALEVAAKQVARRGVADWAFDAAIDAADAVLASTADQRARRDLAMLRSHTRGGAGVDVGADRGAAVLPTDEPADGARFLAWIERRIALPRVPVDVPGTAPSPSRLSRSGSSPSGSSQSGASLTGPPTVRSGGAAGAELLPGGLPSTWLGVNFEVYGVPTATGSTVSMAVRWHGRRPAVLWEQTGEPVRLTAPVMAPQWSDDAVKGETLWPEPVEA